MTSDAGFGRFTGTAALTRLALRRDRILIPVWVAVFALFAGGSAVATVDLYPDLAGRRMAAAAVDGNPALVALYGRIYDRDSLGALALFKASALGAALVGVLALMLVVRHTRAEEEAGRAELLGAGVVGRLASLTAALCATGVAIGALAVVTTIALIGAGLPVVGSLTFGLSWAVTGLVFAAIAAVTAQLTITARGASGLALAVLGGTYVLRAIGDVADGGGARWLSWLSPIGWAQQLRPFAGDRAWVALLGLGLAAAMIAGAYALVGRRDLGAGVRADRAGVASARRLGTPYALAWRLQRTTVLAWTVTYALLGALLGNLATSVDSFLQSPQARKVITTLGGGQAGLIDAFFATEMSFLGVFTAAFAIQAVLRLRGEEDAGRADPVLATAVGRRSWMTSHALVAVGGALWLLAIGGVAAGVARAVATEDAGQIARLVGAALAQAPAVLVMIGVTMTAYGLSARLAVAGWAALVIAVLLGDLGPLFALPAWIMDVSPFAHVLRLPGPSFHVAPLLGLTAVGLALAGVGLATFRRRDLA